MSVADAPSALERAQRTYEQLDECTFASKALGATRLEIMSCDCSRTDADDGQGLCGEDSNCINRATHSECVGPRCGCSDDCDNRRFQKHQYADIDVYDAGAKGFGVRAMAPIPLNGFIYEYMGEVIDQPRFQRRQQQYQKQGVKHFYFMMLQKDEYIDATAKGNISRFCNHSCAPNACVQKWVVGSKFRMGLFALRDIAAGEEITFNYNTDRYGAEAQPCYCGASVCSGWLGGNTQTNGLALPRAFAAALGLTLDDEDAWRDGLGKSKKRRDLDDDAAESLPVKPLAQADVANLVATLIQNQSETWLARKLVERIRISDSTAVQTEVMKMHGYEIFATVLSAHRGDARLARHVIETLRQWPQITKNKISSSKIEGVVRAIAVPTDAPAAEAEASESNPVDPAVSALAADLLDEWGKLQMAYRIPRRERQDDQRASSTGTDATEATDEEDVPAGWRRLASGYEHAELGLFSPEYPSDEVVKRLVLEREQARERERERDRERERERDKERLQARERDKERERQRAAAAAEQQRLEREKQKSELQKIIDDAAAALASELAPEAEPSEAAGETTAATTTTSTTGRSKKPSPEKIYTKVLAKYVPKVVWPRYEQKLGHERCKRHSKELVQLLVAKGLKRDDAVSGELSPEKKKKIKEFTVQYMDKVLAHHERKRPQSPDRANKKRAVSVPSAHA